MFGIGSGEVILILLVAILVLGPKKLPEFARSTGRLIANLKAATSDLKKNLEQEMGIDELNKLNPRRIAEDIMAGEDISDIHPGKYRQFNKQDVKDPYTDENPEEKKEPGGENLKPDDTDYPTPLSPEKTEASAGTAQEEKQNEHPQTEPEKKPE